MNYKSNWRTKLPYKYNVLCSEVWKYSRLFSLPQSLPYPSFFGLSAGSEFQSRGVSVALCLLQALLGLCRAREGGPCDSQVTQVPSLLQNEIIERTRPHMCIYINLTQQSPWPFTTFCWWHWAHTSDTVWSHPGLCCARPWSACWNGAWPHWAWQSLWGQLSFEQELGLECLVQ